MVKDIWRPDNIKKQIIDSNKSLEEFVQLFIQAAQLQIIYLTDYVKAHSNDMRMRFTARNHRCPINKLSFPDLQLSKIVKVVLTERN